MLRYEHLRRRINPVQAQEFVDNVDAMAVMASNLPAIEASRDPADDMILATAVAGAAELVVSGDKTDLLALREIEGIPILTARETLDRLGMADP